MLRCTSSRCVWLRQTALRAHPRINPSTQPADAAGESRSRAAAELALILLSGEKRRGVGGVFVFAFLWERAGSGRRYEEGGLSADHYRPVVLDPCGSWLASEGGLSADHYRPVVLDPCGSWLASEGGLSADHYRPVVLGPCGSWLASEGDLSADHYLPVVLDPCGSWLASEGGLSADHYRPVVLDPCGSELARDEALSSRAHCILLTLSNPNAKSTAIPSRSGQFTGACRRLGYKE
ncbi:hypothetical protein EMIT0347P_20480 [Pseudomonas sp. IT-347P]